jgi:hypothetical protein
MEVKLMYIELQNCCLLLFKRSWNIIMWAIQNETLSSIKKVPEVCFQKSGVKMQEAFIKMQEVIVYKISRLV